MVANGFPVPGEEVRPARAAKPAKAAGGKRAGGKAAAKKAARQRAIAEKAANRTAEARRNETVRQRQAERAQARAQVAQERARARARAASGGAPDQCAWMRGTEDLRLRSPPAWCHSLSGKASGCAAAYVRFGGAEALVARCRYVPASGQCLVSAERLRC